MNVVVTQPRLSETDHEGNLAAIRKIVDTLRAQQTPPDFLVLPELFFRSDDLQAYEQYIREVAMASGACVIGGSVRARVPPDEEELYNAGFVIAPDGNILASYTKRHPYGREVALGTMPGGGINQFPWRGVRCSVMICADAWDYRLLAHLTQPPDLLCIVAASVSEEHGPAAARRLWHALAVARAFELCSIVAISDWAEGITEETRNEGQRTSDKGRGVRMTCGVAGIADPSDLTGRFQPVPAGVPNHNFTVDLDRLHRLRASRRKRSFYFVGTTRSSSGS